MLGCDKILQICKDNNKDNNGVVFESQRCKKHPKSSYVLINGLFAACEECLAKDLMTTVVVEPYKSYGE